MGPKTSRSSITIEGDWKVARTPIHPGEILADELLEIELSAAQLGRTIQVPPNRISQIIAGKRAITADTALRLARYFGTSPDFWMNLQQAYELDRARQAIGKALNHIPQRPSTRAAEA
jgi:addiction module HigA family antidote